MADTLGLGVRHMPGTTSWSVDAAIVEWALVNKKWGDYIAKTGTLTFNPGETMTITIEVKGDSKKEGNETFYLDLFGNSSNSLFTKNRGIGTILNDDWSRGRLGSPKTSEVEPHAPERRRSRDPGPASNCLGQAQKRIPIDRHIDELVTGEYPPGQTRPHRRPAAVGPHAPAGLRRTAWEWHQLRAMASGRAVAGKA
jgi:hypothetical protein